MRPTNRLRFVRRKAPRQLNVDSNYAAIVVQSVLQQWWEADDDRHFISPRLRGEWRDVPTEDETD